MTAYTLLNGAGVASFAIAVACAVVARRRLWWTDRTSAGLCCALWSITSALLFAAAIL